MLYFRSILTVFEKRAFSSVTLNRSEGSVCMGVEMLRYAQHDRVPLALTPDGHPSHSSPPSHSQHLMSFFLRLMPIGMLQREAQ